MILLYQVKVFEYYRTRLLALPPIEEFGHAVQVSENLAICFLRLLMLTKTCKEWPRRPLNKYCLTIHGTTGEIFFFWWMSVEAAAQRSSMDQLLSTRSPSPAKGVAQVLLQRIIMASIFYNSVLYFHSTMQNVPYIDVGQEFISRWGYMYVRRRMRATGKIMY